MRLEDAFEELERDAKGVGEPPFAWFNPDGDTLEVYFEAGPRLAERVDDLISVFVSAEDESRVVGLAIKNITKHFGASGIKGAFLAPGKAKLAALIAGAHFALGYRLERTMGARPVEHLTRYRDLIRRVGDREIDVPKEMFAGHGAPQGSAQ